MKFIDIHSHVNFAAFKEDREAVVARSLEAGVGMINVGTQQTTSRAALELAQKYERGVYASVGLHPIHTSKSFHDSDELGEGGGAGFTSRGEEFDYEFYKKLALDPKVVAIGECGLDYFRDDRSYSAQAPRDKQRKAFEAQIALAKEIKKPLMLHIRDIKGEQGAYADALALIKNFPGVTGNTHFFAGDWATAKKFLDLNFTLSFTGVITFTHDYDEVIKQAPLDMIMAETDAPYVAPVPYRGQRNEPAYVIEVVKKIAEIKGRSFEEVAKVTTENAVRLFGLRLA